MIDPKKIHQLDESLTTLTQEIVPHLANVYKAFIAEGLEESIALSLTQTYISGFWSAAEGQSKDK